jgi:xeroderma pigmentosum group C-complementing protein
LLEAYWESERIAGEKARAKHEDQVIKRWARLIQGLRIRQRLQNQYANKPDDSQQQQKVLEVNSNDKQTDNSEDKDKSNLTAPGGFLVEADDVVQAFSLPEYQHVNLPFKPIPNKSQQQRNLSDDDKYLPVPEYVTYDIQTMDVDPAEIVNDSSLSTNTIAPMTMQELAEAAARKQAARQSAPGIEVGENARTVSDKQNTRTLRSQKSSSHSTPTPTKGVTPVPKHWSVPKTRRAGRSRASRKRRRSGDEEEDDSSIESDEPPIDSDSTGSDHEGGDDQSLPKKRIRTLASSSSHPTSSTRVLRPRRKKTQAQIEQDGEDG